VPREKRRSFDEATARIGVRDRVLDRAAGCDDADDEELTFSERLRREWPDWTMPKRRVALRAEIAVKYRKRFGVPWQPWRAMLVLDPPWPPARMPMQKGKPYESRARFAMAFEYENVLDLPLRADGSMRFLTPLEMTWISLLAGNWPDKGGRRSPEGVVRAELESIKQHRKRYGQRPAEHLGVTRIRRGPQVRTRLK
jgi:hypothetical protein